MFQTGSRGCKKQRCIQVSRESQKILGAPGLGFPLSTSASLLPPQPSFWSLSEYPYISVLFSPPTAFLALHFLGHKRHLLITSALGGFDIRAPHTISSTACAPTFPFRDPSKSYVIGPSSPDSLRKPQASLKSVAFWPGVHRSPAAEVSVESVCFPYKAWMEGGLPLRGCVGGQALSPSPAQDQ